MEERTESLWQRALDAVTEAKLNELASFRGFPFEACQRVVAAGLIGVQNGAWAFPVRDATGAFLGVHKLVSRENKAWLYEPSGIGAWPIVHGELSKAELLFSLESSWDFLAFLILTGSIEHPRFPIICSRGASNFSKLKKLWPEAIDAIAIPQNDEAGQKWLTRVEELRPRELRVVSVPSAYKDLNDWFRDGLTPEGFREAIESAAQKKTSYFVESKVDQEEQVEDYQPTYSFPELSTDALYGLFGRIVALIEPATEADPVAILAQLLVSFGNIVGRAPYFFIEAAEHHTNLFACLVGRSSKGRKGTSLNHVLRLAREIDEVWTAERVESGLSSGEGLIWAVRDPIFKAERDDKTGEVNDVKVDNGVTDKRLYVTEAEFAQTLKVMSRPTNILSSIIRSAWDTGKLGTLVKNNPAKATGAHISIAGHITEEELKRELTQCELFNGFANRFCWLAVKRSKFLPDGGVVPRGEFDELATELRTAIKRATAVGEMKRDGEARSYWCEIYPELSAERVGLAGAVTNRAEAQVLRLSMIYALGDGSSIIGVRHLRAALAFWEYCNQTARYLFGDRLADPNAQRIFDALKVHPEGMTRSEISIQVFQRNIAKETLDCALQTLKNLGFADCCLEETTRRPAERWYAKLRK